MLEIAGGVVLGGIILFIMAAFAEELIKLAMWIVGIIAAILAIIAAAYMVGSSLAVAGVQADDRFADGLLALVPIAGFIFLAVKLVKWTKRIQPSSEEKARLEALTTAPLRQRPVQTPVADSEPNHPTVNFVIVETSRTRKPR